MTYRRFSCKERFMQSTSPLVQSAFNVRGLCLILYKWHSVIISLFMNSVPLSVKRISGNPNFAIQCSYIHNKHNKHYNGVLY